MIAVAWCRTRRRGGPRQWSSLPVGTGSAFSGGTNGNREDRFLILRVTGKRKMLL